jgi:eukaryotic-like serine/threonine-protein kinase
MPLDPGTLLGPYEILGPIGAGGMGEVYKARDTRLERTVAIKVSKQAFEERFRNEALAIAALNHPHIATLHDVGPDYLVMELVAGKPLRGPLPVPEVVRLAGHVADALEHAHERGIVHRDLKPSNIMVTKAGAKVLDFGLARRSSPLSPNDATQETLSEAGVVAGTPRYMAPEQIDGQKADQRTDIFAFGLVLYELLTGERAFDGKSAASVMAAILEKEPRPISALRPATPLALAEVVTTCLAKDPAERWQSARELKHALRWASHAGTAAPARRRSAWIALAAAAAAAALAASAVALLRRTPEASPHRVRLQIRSPVPTSSVLFFAVSPDGNTLAMSAMTSAGPRLFVRALDATEWVAVPVTQPSFQPFWSPDGRQLGYWTVDAGLQRVELPAGPIRGVCKGCRGGGIGGVVDHGTSWGRAGVIVFSDSGTLFRVPATGGDAEPLGALLPGEQGRFWPQFLPDGRHYIYLSLGPRKEDRGIYVGRLDSDLRKRIVATDFRAAYAQPGWLLYLQETTLVAQAFDAARLELSGEPSPILAEPVVLSPGSMLGGAASFSVSENGVLAWLRSNPRVSQLTWFDRTGRTIGTIGEPLEQGLMDLSPDERTVAVCRGPFGRRDIWMVDAANGTSRRLTFDPHDDCGPAFSPDARRIIFNSDRRGAGRDIYERSVDGTGGETLLVESDGLALGVEAWSADGRFLSYSASRPGQSHDLFLLPLVAPRKASPIAFLATPAMEKSSTLAPNGRYMAYEGSEPGASPEAGPLHVYVQEIAADFTPGPGRWQVSTRVGVWPQWRPDGKELFYLRPSTVEAVEVRLSASGLSFGEPKQLGIDVAAAGGPRYRVSRDGQRLLFAVPVKRTDGGVEVLVNWRPLQGSGPSGS